MKRVSNPEGSKIGRERDHEELILRAKLAKIEFQKVQEKVLEILHQLIEGCDELGVVHKTGGNIDHAMVSLAQALGTMKVSCDHIITSTEDTADKLEIK